MNVTLSFLRDRVPSLPESPDEVAELLGRRGFKAIRVEPLAELLRPVVAGRVESVAQHPHADRPGRSGGAAARAPAVPSLGPARPRAGTRGNGTFAALLHN